MARVAWIRRGAGGWRVRSAVSAWSAPIILGSVLAWGGAPVHPPAAAAERAELAPEARGDLRIVKFGGPQEAYHVVSSLIVGPSEAILWDAQYRVSDGISLAEEISATGAHLKAIVLSHADHDHYMGAMEVLKRFPGTPVYMSGPGLADFRDRSQRDFAREQARGGAEVPDSIVTPQLLPAGGLDVDGHELEVLEGLGGDVRGGKSTALWIPSIRTVLAGDLVFEGIHPWLGDSDIQARVEWRESLRRIAALNPLAVVPGHKRDLTTPDSPNQINFMLRYLDAYDERMRDAEGPDGLAKAMVEAYPDLSLPVLMAYGARKWFKR